MQARKMILAGVLLLVGAVQAGAEVVKLTTDNSIVRIDPTSQAGMYYWGILNAPSTYQNQLVQQWFWYRVGTDAERSIDTISTPVISGLTDRTVTTTYHDSAGRFDLSITYSLAGGLSDSGTADIGEQISIHNISGTPLDFHFYQYSDFCIGGTPENDTIVLSINGFTQRINQADQFDGSCIVEVVNTPNANHGEAAVVPATITKLNDSSADILDDTKTSAFGDVAWALQWDFNIPTGSTQNISKDKLLQIPEPGAMSLLAIGGLALIVHRRKR